MRIIHKIISYYKTDPDKPRLQDEEQVKKIYEKKRPVMFWSLVFGYSFFYVCRLSFSVAKKPMLDDGILNAADMGKIGSALLIIYAFGRFINGFVGDRCNIRKFMATGLLVSAVLNIMFGCTSYFIVFLILWLINGWFQSMGSAPSVVSISQWFSNKERGTRYGLWSTAHSMGEAITYLGTAVIISYLDWRWGFRGVGIVSLFVAITLFYTLADRPQTYGLPSIADYKKDYAQETKKEDISVTEAQIEVIKNPAVWILGLSSASMYVARYGISSWGVLYLQEAKGYYLVSAGFLLFWAKIMETLGAASSGWISDFFFKAQRNVVALIYGFLEVLGLTILFTAPSTYIFTLDISYDKHLKDGKIDAAVIKVFDEKKFSLDERAQVSTTENFLFSMDIKHLNESISDWQEEFRKNQRILSSTIKVEKKQDELWVMVDRENEQKYILKIETEKGIKKLNVYTQTYLIVYNDWYMKWKGYRIENRGVRLNVYSEYNILHILGMSLFGFGLGGLLVFLGGLIAVDICSKKASGAAMGLIGIFSYMGAAAQDWVSGALIEAGKIPLNGQYTHNFDSAFCFWLGAASLSLVLYSTICKVKPKD